MARQTPSVEGRPRHPRAVFQLVMLLAVAAILALATVGAWNITSAGIGVVTTERAGVAYLRPLTALIGELAEAESTAVRGGEVQVVVVNGAINKVDSADRRYGAKLAVHKRWTDTRKAINEVITDTPLTTAAFDQYGEVGSLVRQLVLQIAETSKLILDSAVDSSYLVTAALPQLPDIIIGAGKAADLAILDPATGGDPTTQTRVSVARYDVAILAESVGVGLAKSLDGTDSRTLGATITGQLDAFRSAVDLFVPSGTRLRSLEPADAANLTRAATMVRQAARPLVAAVLGELDSMLGAREHTLRWQRLRSVGTTLLGLIIVLLLLGLLGPISLPSGSTNGGAATADSADRFAAGSRGRKPETSLIDPRDLLAVEELMHSGRATRTSGGERDRGAR